MPLWVILLVLSLCFTSITGVYFIRKNGLNNQRNSNGNGHTLSQMTKAPDQSSSGESSPQGVKTSLISSLPAEKQEEGEEIHAPVLSERKKISNDPSPPDEDPHDHQEDHQQEPPPALRERRRMVVRPREDEEEDEDDQSSSEESSPAQKSSIPQSDTLPFENDTHEDGRGESQRKLPDEEAAEPPIVKKNIETQTTVLQEDKGVETYLDTENIETQTQSSPISKDQATQAMPETKDMGTGEWVALQKSIGVGNHLETAEKGIQAHTDMLDDEAQISTVLEHWIIQESPSHHDEAVETNPLVEMPSKVDHSMQAIPETIEEGVEQSRLSFEDKGIGSQLSLKEQGVGKSLEEKSEGIQYSFQGNDKSVQKTFFQHSIGVGSQGLELSEIPPFKEKSNPFFSGFSSFTINSDPEDLRKIDIPRTNIGVSILVERESKDFPPKSVIRQKPTIQIVPLEKTEEVVSPYFKLSLPKMTQPDLDNLKSYRRVSSVHIQDISEIQSEWVLRSRSLSTSALRSKSVQKEKEKG